MPVPHVLRFARSRPIRVLVLRTKDDICANRQICWSVIGSSVPAYIGVLGWASVGVAMNVCVLSKLAPVKVVGRFWGTADV